MAQTVKNWPAMQDTQFDPWMGKMSWRRDWLLTPVFFLGEFLEQRRLAGYSPWDPKESNMADKITVVVQWLRLQAITAEGPGSILGQGAEIPQATWYSKKLVNKQK